ncbi:hypothetical protein [Paenibacillus sp. PL2-23]|uniref:hypothetical protein n=1 Tax=Paenibacillus sp. PL2-23 TaxID=2100729 RepID=UPI0030FAFA44
MLLVTLLFALIAYIEYRHLRIHGRKRKTYVKVFGLMTGVYIYCVLFILLPAPSFTAMLMAVARMLK